MQVCLHPFQAFRFRISNEVILFQKIPHRFHSLFGLLPVLGILYIASFSILGNAPVQMPVGFQCFPQFFKESIVIALAGVKAVKYLLQIRLHLPQLRFRPAAPICPVRFSSGQLQVALPVR